MSSELVQTPRRSQRQRKPRQPWTPSPSPKKSKEKYKPGPVDFKDGLPRYEVAFIYKAKLVDTHRQAGYEHLVGEWWKGWPPEDDSVLPLSDLYCKDLLEHFEKETCIKTPEGNNRAPGRKKRIVEATPSSCHYQRRLGRATKGGEPIPEFAHSCHRRSPSPTESVISNIDSTCDSDSEYSSSSASSRASSPAPCVEFLEHCFLTHGLVERLATFNIPTGFQCGASANPKPQNPTRVDDYDDSVLNVGSSARKTIAAKFGAQPVEPSCLTPETSTRAEDMEIDDAVFNFSTEYDQIHDDQPSGPVVQDSIHGVIVFTPLFLVQESELALAVIQSIGDHPYWTAIMTLDMFITVVLLCSNGGPSIAFKYGVLGLEWLVSAILKHQIKLAAFKSQSKYSWEHKLQIANPSTSEFCGLQIQLSAEGETPVDDIETCTASQFSSLIFGVDLFADDMNELWI
ncbi:hypothetical protein DL96DRAFT_1574106 [Flagelloscypha sp. PMI_526]|nr:hypothetical protein DL96DRAFT_1574106 [Flagelloscypha sp. PMI_526]